MPLAGILLGDFVVQIVQVPEDRQGWFQTIHFRLVTFHRTSNLPGVTNMQFGRGKGKPLTPLETIFDARKNGVNGRFLGFLHYFAQASVD